MNNRVLFFVAAFASSVVLLYGSGAYAQAVQLPTFGYTGVATTVSVPDRGSTYMGGVNRAAYGSNQYGAPLLPFGNRSMGSEVSAGSHSMSVYIHDFEEMDQYLLNSPTPVRSSTVIANGNKNLPIRIVSTQARKASEKSPMVRSSMGKSPEGVLNQVAVQVRKKTLKGKAAPLVLSGRRAEQTAVANIRSEQPVRKVSIDR